MEKKESKTPPLGCPLTGFVVPAALGGVQYNRPACGMENCGFWIRYTILGATYEDCAIRAIGKSLVALAVQAAGGEDGE